MVSSRLRIGRINIANAEMCQCLGMRRSHPHVSSIEAQRVLQVSRPSAILPECRLPTTKAKPAASRPTSIMALLFSRPWPQCAYVPCIPVALRRERQMFRKLSLARDPSLQHRPDLCVSCSTSAIWIMSSASLVDRSQGSLIVLLLY